LAVCRTLTELRARDPRTADDVEGALEWVSGETGSDPLVLTRYDLQVFLWYLLPRKWLISLEHKRAVAEAFARFLERVDDRVRDHAALCRSNDTQELLALWEQDDPHASRRFLELMDDSGLEPPDTALLAWGDLMGPGEADLRHRAALALETAMEDGELRPGARDLKRRRATTLEGFLSGPLADLDGHTPIEVIHAERMERWLERGSTERQALLDPVAALLRAVPDAPLPAVEAALEPLSWLLRAAGEGIALTQTGALNRALVREAAERYPGWWRADFFGPPSREDEVSALVELDALVRNGRLVRRKGRRLLLTRRGADRLGSPQDLLATAADGALTATGFPAAVQELSVAVLIAEREVASSSLDAKVHAAIVADGWSAEGESPSEREVGWATWGLIRPALALGLVRDEGEWGDRRLIVTEVGRAALCGALRRRAVAPTNEW